MLLGALDTLDVLLGTLESRGTTIVGSLASPPLQVPAPLETEDEVVIDLRAQGVLNPGGTHGPPRISADIAPGSESSSARGSSFSGG